LELEGEERRLERLGMRQPKVNTSPLNRFMSIATKNGLGNKGALIIDHHTNSGKVSLAKTLSPLTTTIIFKEK
jgi:hypothetical protein